MMPHAKNGEDKACDDLFAAACLDAKGDRKYKDQSKSIPASLRKPILEARDKAAQAMGYQNFSEALKAKLQATGVLLKEPPDNLAWSKLKNENTAELTDDEVATLYAGVNQCEQDAKLVVAKSDVSKMGERELIDAQKKIEAFTRQYNEKEVLLRTADIGNFVTNHIGARCTVYKNSPSKYPRDRNPEIAAACENFDAIKREAIDIYRLEGSAAYKARAETFVRNNLLPSLRKAASESDPSSKSKLKSTSKSANKAATNKLASMREEVSSDLHDIATYCADRYAFVLHTVALQTTNKLLKQVTKSKPLIESVIASFYGDARHAKAETILKQTREDVQAIVSDVVKDTTKRSQILDDYDRIQLAWISRPSDSVYTKGSSGLAELDEDKISTFNPL
jgi:hypothetical protein